MQPISILIYLEQLLVGIQRLLVLVLLLELLRPFLQLIGSFPVGGVHPYLTYLL